MKKLTDREIQELFDRGEAHELSGETGLYKNVFEALKKEPAHKLSVDFSNTIVNKVTSKTSRVEKFLYVICGIGVLSTLVLGVVLIKIFASPTMITYLPYMGIGFVMIGVLHWLDKYSRLSILEID
ncbi:hypothetical protein E1176_05035, partial [Fulvivirga sp. RKSG066]|uniref:hypothetical protein n=1 Tax=Fulvivirga aurantia TaxID=2529383 RepID=UPI0012BCD656